MRKRWALAVLLAFLALAGCGAEDYDAAGLRFQVPDGFQVTKQRAGRADAYVFHGDAGTLVLAWTRSDDPPDAAAVVDVALRRRGISGVQYAVADLTSLETREVAASQADYVDTVWAPREGSGPRQRVRMVLFSAGDATYLVALVTDAEGGDPAGAVWERFLASLQWTPR